MPFVGFGFRCFGFISKTFVLVYISTFSNIPDSRALIRILSCYGLSEQETPASCRAARRRGTTPRDSTALATLQPCIWGEQTPSVSTYYYYYI